MHPKDIAAGLPSKAKQQYNERRRLPAGDRPCVTIPQGSPAAPVRRTIMYSMRAICTARAEQYPLQQTGCVTAGPACGLARHHLTGPALTPAQGPLARTRVMWRITKIQAIKNLMRTATAGQQVVWLAANSCSLALITPLCSSRLAHRRLLTWPHGRSRTVPA